jgi:hypothetical protein
MTEKELLSQIDAINQQCEALSSQRAELLRQWVELVCPYKVGEVTEVLGYSHKGKMARIIEVNANVKWQYGDKKPTKYEWWVKARVLKKDGNDSSLTTDWEQLHWESRL